MGSPTLDTLPRRPVNIPGGLRFVLPSPRGVQRFIGLPLVAVGLLLLPAFGAGLPLLGIGLFLTLGHAEFEVRGQRFRLVRRLGPLRFGRWRECDTLEAFGVERFGSNPDAKHFVLRAHVGEERPLNMTGGQNPALLESIARDIARAVDPGNPPTVEIGPIKEDTGEPAPIVETPDPGDPPPGSTMWIERTPSGVTVFVPCSGLLARTPRAMFGFAIIWLAITNGILVAMFLAGGPVLKGGLFLAGGVLLLFEAVGVWVLLYGVSLARRKAILDVTDDAQTLLITRSGLIRSEQHQLRRDDLTAIDDEDSNTSINNRRLRRLRISIRGRGNDLRILEGRRDEDLAWLAGVLRHALGLPTSPVTPGEDED